MDFDLNEEQRMLVDMLATMGKREDFKKLAVEIDRTGEFPTHLVEKYAELGLLGMTLSPEHGGGGLFRSLEKILTRSGNLQLFPSVFLRLYSRDDRRLFYLAHP